MNCFHLTLRNYIILVYGLRMRGFLDELSVDKIMVFFLYLQIWRDMITSESLVQICDYHNCKDE